ncbi:hypothetical protein ACOSP7_003305 [Xanthoceras sorbifolium]
MPGLPREVRRSLTRYCPLWVVRDLNEFLERVESLSNIHKVCYPSSIHYRSRNFEREEEQKVLPCISCAKIVFICASSQKKIVFDIQLKYGLQMDKDILQDELKGMLVVWVQVPE